MSGIAKTAKKVHSLPRIKKVAQQAYNPLNILETGAEELGEAFTPEIPEPEEQTIIPIPTESTAALEAKKRRARAKSTGRQSTILTEGLGG